MPTHPEGRRAGALAGDEPAQMAVHAGGPERFIHAATRYSTASVFARSGILANERGSEGDQPDGLRRATRAAVPVAQIVVPDAVFRARAYPRDPAVTHLLGEEAGGPCGCRRTVRARGAGTVLGGVLPVPRLG